MDGYVEDYSYSSFPAVKIARLLVDSRYRGAPYGLGRLLVSLALGITKDEVCPAVGCRFVMVDAKKESVKFYEKCGFRALNTDENKERDIPVMFIDLLKT